MSSKLEQKDVDSILERGDICTLENQWRERMENHPESHGVEGGHPLFHAAQLLDSTIKTLFNLRMVGIDFQRTYCTAVALRQMVGFERVSVKSRMDILEKEVNGVLEAMTRKRNALVKKADAPVELPAEEKCSPTPEKCSPTPEQGPAPKWKRMHVDSDDEEMPPVEWEGKVGVGWQRFVQQKLEILEIN